jgi:hypothetical protein
VQIYTTENISLIQEFIMHKPKQCERRFEFAYCKVFGDTIDFSYLEQGAALKLTNKEQIIESFTITFAYRVPGEIEKKYVEIPVKGNMLNCDALEALKKSTKPIPDIKLEALKVLENGKIHSVPGIAFYVKF